MADYLFQRMDKIRGTLPAQPGDTLAWFRQTARDLVSISGTTPAKVMQAKDVISFDGMNSAKWWARWSRIITMQKLPTS